MPKNIVKVNESTIRQIVTESVKKLLEDRQRIPFASVLEYANKEMPIGFQLEYDDASRKITIKQEHVGFGDISANGLLSGYFEALSNAFKVMEKYTLGGTGYEGIWINGVGKWTGKMTLAFDKDGMYYTDAQFSGLPDNGDDMWAENPYDNTEYYELLKNPDYVQRLNMATDSKVDNRKSARSLRYHLNRADKTQLHNFDSWNQELMDYDMMKKIKGTK